MVSFTINLEVISWVGAQCKGNFSWWHEVQRRNIEAATGDVL